VLLVKNIPFDTEVDELRRMFSKHGTLGRVVLPPSKSMVNALIQLLISCTLTVRCATIGCRGVY
jgi:multiple RNA-binding domain-containing protein 1